jgi:hypothetical protein
MMQKVTKVVDADADVRKSKVMGVGHIGIWNHKDHIDSGQHDKFAPQANSGILWESRALWISLMNSGAITR